MTKKTLSEIQEMLAKGELQKVSDEPADEDLHDDFWDKAVVRKQGQEK